MIALLFALLVTDPPAVSPASPPTVSGGSPAARAEDPPTVPVPYPCPGASSGTTTLPPGTILPSGGTIPMTNGDEAGSAPGLICHSPAALAVVPPLSAGTEAVTTPPVRSSSGAVSSSYAAGLAVAPSDPSTPPQTGSGGNPAARADDPPVPTPTPCGGQAGAGSVPAGTPALGNSGTMSTSNGDCAGTRLGTTGSTVVRFETAPPAPGAAGPAPSVEARVTGATTPPVRSGGGATSSSYAAGLAIAPSDPTPGTAGDPLPIEHVVSPCPPPSSGSTITANTGSEPGSSSGNSPCPRPGLGFSQPIAGVRAAAPPAPGSDAAPGEPPRRFLGLSRRQWGWVGAVAGAVVLGVIVSDDGGGSSPVGPDGT